jgi:hypothetical protein
LNPAVTLDVGANIGYFSLAFAERGSIAYAVEGEPINLRIATIAARHTHRQSGGVFVPLNLWCTPVNITTLPECDVSLCLSIWHHWVRNFGLDGATSMLGFLLEKTSGALFFDTGENEMPSAYNLPFRGADSGKWLSAYLERLPNARAVHCLGQYPAFMPMSDERHANVTRHLFVVER